MFDDFATPDDILDADDAAAWETNMVARDEEEPFDDTNDDDDDSIVWVIDMDFTDHAELDDYGRPKE